MKKMLTLIALVAVVMLVSATCFAQGTMWAQEGTAADSYAPIDGKTGITYDPAQALTNFVNSYGGGSFSGVYAQSQGWVTGSTSGDEAIDVEADVEMYYQSATTNNKIYFHIANPNTVTIPQTQSTVYSTQTTNHPMYVGITFPTAKADINWEGGLQAPTGKVIGGMQGTKDLMDRDITDTMDISFLMSVNGAAFVPPTSAGTTGADNTISDSTMWWNPTVTGVGTANLRWLVQIYPKATQADGNYNLDPMISVSPEL